MCPTPSTWNVWLHWCAGPPPFSYILFLCSRVCWHALPFSLQLDTIGTYWNHHEPPETIWKLHYPRTSWNLYDPTILLDVPLVPETYGCTGVQVPPPFHAFYSHPKLFGHALPFSILVDTIGTTWNHVELLGFSWMCPTPSTWNVWLHWCAGPPPFHTFYSHALGCVGMRCHSP